MKTNQDFNDWNEIKKLTDSDEIVRNFKEREIFYLKMGKNIGFEQNGKGKNFVRPVIILKKFNRNMFFGVPLSTQEKEGNFYFSFEFTKNEKIYRNIALLSQMKLYSSNRLLNKIGMISKSDFIEIKQKLKSLID
ncbi:MAG: type II toxin-antitoxin system PemK/MazF family toxin [Sulfurimonas sp.]|nr:type II toxin-antitoxin system PemK/MazF family toxin [Sulfurimonas sp.]MDQ7061195.1 type II toxin-antitoxin system PemK/MazF family toxin [Sulfurimonas sp.]